MLTARSTKWYIVNDPYGKADRMNEVNKEMVNELIFDILDYRILFSAKSRKFNKI